YCVSCDWSQFVTWYKAIVNSLVPCDLCDHSQILLVVSNDVRSEILLTTICVITDWPISDHMIRTRGGLTIWKLEHFPRAQAGTGSWCRALPGSTHRL
ncbi:unnamed protein product, partial [Staurois parvus]